MPSLQKWLKKDPSPENGMEINKVTGDGPWGDYDWIKEFQKENLAGDMDS